MSQAEMLPTFPFARETGFEPAALLAQLRAECPITKVKLFDGSESWLLLKRKECCAALESTHLSADRRHPGYPELHESGAKAKEKPPTFVNLDDPQHAQQRALLDPWFTKDAVQKLRPEISLIVEAILRDLIERHGEHTEHAVDFVQEFAALVPTQIVYKLLGLPDADISLLLRESEIRLSTSRDAAQSSEVNLHSYIERFVDTQIEHLDAGMVGSLVQDNFGTAKLTKEEIVELAFLVLVAGNAAVINAIALGVVTLLQHPKQLAELKEDPKLAPVVVSELLRYHTVSALNCRRAVKKDIIIGGQEMKKNDSVICAVQSADRDEDYFAVPDKLDIHRRLLDPNDTLAFGWGVHRCQAEWLARAELEIVFGTLFQHLPNLRLAVPVEELISTPANQNIGVTEIPVMW